jgi:hypothetical protein
MSHIVKWNMNRRVGLLLLFLYFLNIKFWLGGRSSGLEWNGREGKRNESKIGNENSPKKNF